MGHAEIRSNRCRVANISRGARKVNDRNCSLLPCSVGLPERARNNDSQRAGVVQQSLQGRMNPWIGPS